MLDWLLATGWLDGAPLYFWAAFGAMVLLVPVSLLASRSKNVGCWLLGLVVSIIGLTIGTVCVLMAVLEL